MLADGPRAGKHRAAPGGRNDAGREPPAREQLGARRNCLTLEGLMAERCQLCGARWEVGASTCRDCGSRRRITVPPGESSASMPGLAIVRSVLASSPEAASASSSDIAMVRVDASSAPFTAADASATGIAAAREAPASEPAAVAEAADGSGPMPIPVPPVPHDAFASAPFSAAAAPPPSSPVASFSTEPLPSRATTLPPGIPTPLPAGFSQPLGRPAGRSALLLLVAAAGVAVAAGVAYFSLDTPPAEPEAKLAPVEVYVGSQSTCDQLTALAGSWVFTTATTGARRKERLGVRGFYQLQITVDDCTAHASLAKTGRTDRMVFEDEKIPRAEATLAQGESFEAYGWAGTFVLRNEDGQGIDTRFVFALDGERLVGNWRQLGERWTVSGLYGVLEGRRDGDPVAILPERSTQPCAVRCATPEDIGQLDAPDQAAHAACLASCQ
jgi:hypothetical protein